MARLLRVPAERAHLEAVEERDETRLPNAPMQVDRVDAVDLEITGVAFELLDALLARRVHELRVGPLAPRVQLLGVRRAQPQPRRRAMLRGDREHRFDHLGMLGVDRQLVVGAERLVELGERRHVDAASSAAVEARTFWRRSPRPTVSSCTSTTCPSLLNQASVSSPVAPSSRPLRNAAIVFSGCSTPRSAMGEGDRRVHTRILALTVVHVSSGPQRRVSPQGPHGRCREVLASPQWAVRSQNRRSEDRDDDQGQLSELR